MKFKVQHWDSDGHFVNYLLPLRINGVLFHISAQSLIKNGVFMGQLDLYSERGLIYESIEELSELGFDENRIKSHMGAMTMNNLNLL